MNQDTKRDRDSNRAGTAVTVRTIALEECGTIHGVTCDAANRVWFAAGEGDLVCVEPATGRILRRFADVGARAGTAFDGSHVWQLTEDEIVRIDPESGAIVRRLPAPEGVHASGMAYAEGALWIGDFRGQGIVKVDVETGEVVKRLAADRFVTGVTWLGEDLWHGAWEVEDEPRAPTLRRVDPDSGAVLAELAFPDAFGVTGIGGDTEGRLWCGGGFAGGLRAVRVEARSADS